MKSILILILFILTFLKFSLCKKTNNMKFSEEFFWQIIELSKNDKDYIYEKNIINKLSLLSDSEIYMFEDILVAKMQELYTWDSYGVLVILDIYPTMPEHFWDFRTWVIAQGKDFYYSFLKNPDILAKEIVESKKNKIYLDFVDLLYVSKQTLKLRYKEQFKEEMDPSIIINKPYDLENFKGVEWNNMEDLNKRFPDLCRRIKAYRDNR